MKCSRKVAALDLPRARLGNSELVIVSARVSGSCHYAFKLCVIGFVVVSLFLWRTEAHEVKKLG